MLLWPGQHQLLDQARQALGKNSIRRLGVLVVIKVQQFQNKGELLEGISLGLGVRRCGLASLDILIKAQQGFPLFWN